jgi:hypothetical protein
MIEKKIGKITNVKFGRGGYQDAMMGIQVSLGSEKDCWGVSDFRGDWGVDTEASVYASWSEEDRLMNFGKVVSYVNELLLQAKVYDVASLKGIPIEATFEGNTLKSWRVLEEVL